MLNATVAPRGLAVAPHSLAAQAALSILREGGNAIEAMVAAASAIAVVYPHMNGIGGDGFWLVMPPDGEPVTIDASGPAGSLATLDRYAGRERIPFRGADAALTVPGTVDGWRVALELAGELAERPPLPLPRLLSDAIHYASQGMPVTHSQVAATRAKHSELEHIPGFAESFLVDGRVPQEASLFKQPKIAATLSRLAANGLDDFYRGELAGSIAADIGRLGMPVTAADLAGYRARRGTPLKLAHSTGEIFNLAPPTQGLVSQMILGISDRLGLSTVEADSADHIHALVEATKRAFAVRDSQITDPACMRIDPQACLESAALDREAAAVDMARAAPWGEGKGPGDTIWMGVIDESGLAVSFIQSIYHEFGSGVVLPGSGINWQNRGASFSLDPGHILALAPGKQPFHTLNPAAARLSDGRTLVYGTMGGDGQPQTQAAVYSRYAVFGQGLQQAVSAPRWLLGRTWGDTSDSLKLESRFPQAVVEALAERGHEVELLAPFSETMGHAGAVVRHPNGVLEGAFDPRSNGAAAGF
ncbi:gamma-glutamyltransferase family protein [Halotalea alkalilenta]|uniref:Gamma-glutamyltransferase n=1 Tax=Halotalea alkalilenta TaxID=376489 RepID=A0A172YIZ6_9GAMM|nr:gamma-glutamyltransferase [Halotalea alkalilenta]ANF59180.1 gamma-glutamyltransferase [Halotalea alkalilenta]